MSDELTGIDNLADAVRSLAEAIAYHADAVRPPAKKPAAEYHCPGCGSPLWEPGGMGLEWKRCLDCGTIGDSINAPTDGRS